MKSIGQKKDSWEASHATQGILALPTNHLLLDVPSKCGSNKVVEAIRSTSTRFVAFEPLAHLMRNQGAITGNLLVSTRQSVVHRAAEAAGIFKVKALDLLWDSSEVTTESSHEMKRQWDYYTNCNCDGGCILEVAEPSYPDQNHHEKAHSDHQQDDEGRLSHRCQDYVFHRFADGVPSCKLKNTPKPCEVSGAPEDQETIRHLQKASQAQDAL
mmetsp:Transcript_64599/g.114912  ORF Transcript_64599/g.114912 Transcript_64599/m.114912 type:complete len:213 (-) Transcript_64599:879-1517(-)